MVRTPSREDFNTPVCLGVTLKLRIAGLLISLTMLAAWRAWAGGVPILDLAALVDASDLVAVGEVSAVSEIGKTTMTIQGKDMSADVMEAEMRVDRAIKGTATQVIRFRFPVPASGTGYRGVVANSYKLAFFKRHGQVLEFTSPFQPSFPAVSTNAERSGSPFDLVVSEIAAVLGSTISSEDDKVTGIRALRVARTSAATAALKAAAFGSAGEIVRLTAVAALLARNDISVLPVAEEALTNPQASVPDEIRQNLAAAIYEGAASEDAIPALTRLLRVPDARVREASAHALRDTKSYKATDALALALNDADLEVRYYGVIGLAEITGQNEWRPLEDDFKANENGYLDHWKTWALSR
jgi:hypothetical protein